MIAAHLDPALAAAVTAMEARDTPFAFATVIRTVGSTAAQPGTKALLSAEGDIIGGWLGGACTRAAVRKAVQEAVQDGQPRLVSIAPEDALRQDGMVPGEEVAGVHYAKNGCPSKGWLDIFIEPCLPAPELVIFGSSPVASALTRLAGEFHWDILPMDPKAALPRLTKRRCILIATQGQGDMDALRQSLDAGAEYVGFVGSVRKFAALSEKLLEQGFTQDQIASVRAPAGLSIGAVTPEEIALSALAELTQVRRKTIGGRHG